MLLISSMLLSACGGKKDKKKSDPGDASPPSAPPVAGQPIPSSPSPGGLPIPLDEEDDLPTYSGRASDLCFGHAYYDKDGNRKEGTKDCGQGAAACVASGDTGCMVGDDLIAVRLDEITPGRIKYGVQIGTVTGAYPSAQFPLVPGTAAEDGELADEVSSQRSGTYGFFSSDGGYHQLTVSDLGAPIAPTDAQQDFAGDRTLFRPFSVAGDGNLRAANIRSGVSIFGVDGIVSSRPYDCAADNETDCVAVDEYPAVRRAGIDAGKLSSQITVAGVTGTMKHCRSGANTGLYDNSVSPATTGLDPFDTVDDYNNFSNWLTNAPFGVHYLCDEADWEFIPAGSSCTSANDSCVFRDKITNLMWTELTPGGVGLTWSDAVAACDQLVFAGYSDWRLPTQKELMQAYIDGIANLGIKYRHFGSPRVYHWAATSVSTPTGGTPAQFPNAWVIDLSNGTSSPNLKTALREYRCVR